MGMEAPHEMDAHSVAYIRSRCFIAGQRFSSHWQCRSHARKPGSEPGFVCQDTFVAGVFGGADWQEQLAVSPLLHYLRGAYYCCGNRGPRLCLVESTMGVEALHRFCQPGPDCVLATSYGLRAAVAGIAERFGRTLLAFAHAGVRLFIGVDGRQWQPTRRQVHSGDCSVPDECGYRA